MDASCIDCWFVTSPKVAPLYRHDQKGLGASDPLGYSQLAHGVREATQIARFQVADGIKGIITGWRGREG